MYIVMCRYKIEAVAGAFIVVPGIHFAISLKLTSEWMFFEDSYNKTIWFPEAVLCRCSYEKVF